MTLIDYPGKIAATVFTVGCNFRCPFCHNPELVAMNWSGGHGLVSEKDFFAFMDTRKGKLDGVCITGGEPTIQPDILNFMKKIKEHGFLVKLDSNGTRPDVLKKAIDDKLVDYLAMDIKSSLENYEKACLSGQIAGSEKPMILDKERIKLSVDLIRNSGINYEFRTTVVPGIHSYEDFEKIGQWLKGVKNYNLQAFQNSKVLDEKLMKDHKDANLDLEKIKEMLAGFIEKISIR